MRGRTGASNVAMGSNLSKVRSSESGFAVIFYTERAGSCRARSRAHPAGMFRKQKHPRSNGGRYRLYRLKKSPLLAQSSREKRTRARNGHPNFLAIGLAP